MASFEIIGLMVLCALAWLWFDSVHVRDIGVRAARAACDAEGLQLLDDTVSIESLRLARDDDGRLRLCRAYAFDYSDTGDNRRRGRVVLLGSQVIVVNVGLRAAPHLTLLH